MRIVCQKCSAAYAIDDKFVTDKGVRAQCPRCRHLQMVKKGDAPSEAAPPPAPAAPPSASPFLFDLPPGSTPTAPGAAAPPSSGSPFDFNFAAPPPTRQPAPPPPAPAAPLSAPQTRSPFDFDLVAPPPPPPPPAAAPPPAAPALPDFPMAPPPAAFEPPGFDFGAPPPGAPSAAAELDALTAGAPVRCKSCGKSISDPFDIALGTCDDCRSKQQERVDLPTPDTNPGKSERVDVAAISSSVASSRSSPNLGPAPAQPDFSSPPPMSVAQTTAVRSAMRDTQSSNSARTVLGVVAVLVAIGSIVGLLLWKKPWVRRPPKVTTAAASGSSKSIDAIVQRWKLNYPELADEDSGQARAHVEAGEAELAKDTTGGYREAEQEFEKALVLDSSSDRAIAGWVLAVAFGRGGDIDDLTSKAADSMLTAAEQRSGAPMLYVAHAHLDIARGVNANDVQHRAEIGKNSKDPRDKALAMLALGNAQLQKNAQTSEQYFKEALALDPKLKRAYLFQAHLAVTLGKYKEASDALEKRLSLDADQWEAAESLARLDVEVGEVAKARKVLEDARAAAPRNVRPRIALAMLAYQHQGDLSTAAELLNAIVADGDVSKKDQADALSHLATVQRLGGDLDKATASLDRALELQPDHVPARVQQVVVLADRGVASQARLTMDSLKGAIPPALEGVLEGRLLFLENRLPEAVTLLTALADKDPSQTGALLLAGAAAAKSRRDGKAWELCLKRGLKADPLSNPLPAMTHLFVRQADVLRPAVGAWAALSGGGGDEDPNPFLCEGLVAWFSDDLPTADKNFARVTNIDPRSADGFAFRSLVALKRRDIGSAVTQGSRGVAANKTHGLVRAALALALMAANKVDSAKLEAVAANKLAASLLAPRVVMGDAEARQKNPDQARRLLTGVLLADPQYREAKRVLFKQAL